MEAAPIVRPKMPELDTTRGIAILSVLFYHGFFWSNGVTGLQGAARFFVQLTRFGWLGVNLFFVLSGFLITGILIESKQRTDYYKRFYIRRALRILPAFYAVLLVLTLMPSQNGRYLFLSFFYLSNLATLFAIPMTYTMLWSLAVAWFVADGLATGAMLVLFVRIPGLHGEIWRSFRGSNCRGRSVSRRRGSVGHADEAANFGRLDADGVSFLVSGADRSVLAGRDKPVELDCESPHLAILRQH